MSAHPPVVSPWLNVAEAAIYAKYNKQTISSACRDGSLIASQPLGGKWLIHKDDLDTWIRNASTRRARSGRRKSA
jgi:excisionase family DNA binding protein